MNVLDGRGETVGESEKVGDIVGVSLMVYVNDSVGESERV